MSTFSTRAAATRLGVDVATLSRYISSGKVPAPKTVEVGKLRLHLWTEKDIERVRKLLPSLPDRRTRKHRKQKPKK